MTQLFKFNFVHYITFFEQFLYNIVFNNLIGSMYNKYYKQQRHNWVFIIFYNTTNCRMVNYSLSIVVYLKFIVTLLYF